MSFQLYVQFLDWSHVSPGPEQYEHQWCEYIHTSCIYTTRGIWCRYIVTHLVSEISITTWSLMYTSTLETRYPPSPKKIFSDSGNMFKKFLNIHCFHLHYYIINNNNTIHENIHTVSIQIIFISKASIQIIHATPMENVSLCPYVLLFFSRKYNKQIIMYNFAIYHVLKKNYKE